MESGLILIEYYPEIKDTFLATEINKVVSITLVPLQRQPRLSPN